MSRNLRSPNGFGEPGHYSAAFSFGGQQLFSQTFERDELGRIVAIAETNQGVATSTTYTYDFAGRLKTATTAGNTREYAYDANGNRLGTGNIEADYDDQDRIQSFGEWQFQATETGDVLRRTNATQTEGYELIYDSIGGLKRVPAIATGDSVTYESDPLGRRVGSRAGARV